MNNVLLHRITEKGSIRYYSIEIVATLFEEYVVERVYGNVRFKSCTGRKNNVFSSFNEAQIFFEKLKKQKMKKGYAEFLHKK
ncbi:WGR domain superfamily [Campylobacter jejuni subsp. doylei 269.97]|uniref:WGR domain superfamily n=2 Tax=Campylobacter jejuni subsp. doylei TaxID=32021 RepID=A7H3B2_CAMJD|nr:WGR domain superfamily [Campylobacter jejuni subsp. doylei 269.97]AVL47238.1 WGR domain-containing protein [Campylobacter jejuni subsp. doylei]